MHQTLFSLKRAYLSTKKTIDQGLAPYALSWAQLEVLLVLHNAGSLEQRNLRNELGLADPTLTRTLDHLVENGYVKREMTADDSRVKLVSLTPKATTLLMTLEPQENQQLLSLFFKDFSEAEIAVFTDFLRRVEQNMNAVQKEG